MSPLEFHTTRRDLEGNTISHSKTNPSGFTLKPSEVELLFGISAKNMRAHDADDVTLTPSTIVNRRAHRTYSDKALLRIALKTRKAEVIPTEDGFVRLERSDPALGISASAKLDILGTTVE